MIQCGDRTCECRRVGELRVVIKAEDDAAVSEGVPRLRPPATP
jgi:hypothetical protein